jgi:hypothetical protein
MSERRVALIGSWPQRYIDDHRRWLEAHGPHGHGWAHKLSPDNRSLVEATIGAQGCVHFYAYMSLNNGGEGAVRYRVVLNDFAYHSPGVPFAHRHGDHGVAEPATVSLLLSVIGIEELAPARAISDFVTVGGKTLSLRAMRGLYVVDELEALPASPTAGTGAPTAAALVGTA